MLKVKPKPILTATGRTVNITKINVLFITNVPVLLERFNSHVLFIEFIDSEGTTRDSFNAQQSEFVDFLVTKGIERTQAEQQVYTLFRTILGGTDLQKKNSIKTMLALYEYELDETETEPQPETVEETENPNTDEQTA